MECAKCGAQVPSGRKACPACGASVTRTEASSSGGVEALLAEANLYRTKGQFTEALSTGMRILQVNPQHAGAHSLIANIYRDQGNYREALNWFKLSVELDPDNQADKKKLDEMIDKVFQGVMAGELRSSVKALAQTQANGASSQAAQAPGVKGGNPSGSRNLLNKLMPIHIVIGTTALAVILCGVFLWAINRDQPRSHAVPKGEGAHAVSYLNDDQLNAKSTATVNPPVANPPGTTVTPNAANQGPQTIPGLPGVIVKPAGPKGKDATATNIAIKPGPLSAIPPGYNTLPAGTGNKGASEVPPFSPLTPNAGSGNNDVDTQVSLLKPILDNTLKNSKLPATLDAMTLDPRTNSLTLKYTIPPTQTAEDAKKLLLYTGFQLVWAAAEQNKSFANFTLRGYASDGNQHGTTLALFADVSEEQAQAARSVNDYHAIVPYLTNPWWRPDLSAVTL